MNKAAQHYLTDASTLNPLIPSIIDTMTFLRPFIAILIFYSYWVPQIAWNTVCGTRCTIHAIYYIGTTVSRLFIPLYLLGCPNNFFSVLLPGAIPYSPATCVGLVLWSMLQLSMLIAQVLRTQSIYR
jgi:hypothetical protein